MKQKKLKAIRTLKLLTTIYSIIIIKIIDDTVYLTNSYNLKKYTLTPWGLGDWWIKFFIKNTTDKFLKIALIFMLIRYIIDAK